jgi:hypothetical protein
MAQRPTSVNHTAESSLSIFFKKIKFVIVPPYLCSEKNELLQIVRDAIRASGSPSPRVDSLHASFLSTGLIPIGMKKYNKKIMIVTIKDPDLFRVEN